MAKDVNERTIKPGDRVLKTSSHGPRYGTVKEVVSDSLSNNVGVTWDEKTFSGPHWVDSGDIEIVAPFREGFDDVDPIQWNLALG